MLRVASLTLVFLWVAYPNTFGQSVAPEWSMTYTRSHRAAFEQEWTYTFSNHVSTRWVITLRYPPELAWSRDVNCTAELHTSHGWKPFREVRESGKQDRRMLIIDDPNDDPKLRHGFTIRTTITATIYDQQLRKGRPATHVAPLSVGDKENFLAATNTFDFDKPIVKRWMNEHRMWIGKGEKPLDFAHRVYKELRSKLPYNTKDGGPWVCSQILKVGYGECCRHAIVGTSILRANKVPARTVCALWAIDAKSQGAHCWGEFFLDGVGWVPYDTTLDGEHLHSDAYFGSKRGELIAGMIDFDWVIDAGPFGRQTVFAIDAFPAFWSQGKGNMDNPKLHTTTKVRLLGQERGHNEAWLFPPGVNRFQVRETR